MGSLRTASVAQMLRSSQKDRQHITQITSDVNEIISAFLGVRSMLKYREITDVTTQWIYLCLTTLSNRQTLGEEYVNILQTDQATVSSTSFLQRLMSSAVDTAAPSIYKRLPLKSREFFNILSQLERIHFFIFSEYPTLGKRIAGIRYILLRDWLAVNSSLTRLFPILGVAMLLQLIIKHAPTLLQSSPEMEEAPRRTTSGVAKPGVAAPLSCGLCLGICVSPSVTPCGHVFCWQCAVRWISSKNCCSVCRRNVLPQQVVQIVNR